MRYPYLKILIDDVQLTRREKVITAISYVLMFLFVVFIFVGLTSCSTTRKMMCPEAQVVRVIETDHSFIVTYVAECREHTQEVSK